MIYGMVIVSEDDENASSEAGHADSKTLDRQSRGDLVTKLTQASRNNCSDHPNVAWIIVISYATQIDHLLLQNNHYTLNWIAEESTTLLLGLATRFYEINEAHVDTVGPKIRYQKAPGFAFPED